MSEHARSVADEILGGLSLEEYRERERQRGAAAMRARWAQEEAEEERRRLRAPTRLRAAARSASEPVASDAGAGVIDRLRNGGFRASSLLRSPSPADLDEAALRALLQERLDAAQRLPEVEAAGIEASLRAAIERLRPRLDALGRARGRELTLDDLPAPILRDLIEVLDSGVETPVAERTPAPFVALPSTLIHNAFDLVSFQTIGWPPPFVGQIDPPAIVPAETHGFLLFSNAADGGQQSVVQIDNRHGVNQYDITRSRKGKEGRVTLWIIKSAGTRSPGQTIRWPLALSIMARVNGCERVVWVQYKAGKVTYSPQLTLQPPNGPVLPNVGILPPTSDTPDTHGSNGTAIDRSMNAGEADKLETAFSAGEKPPEGKDERTPENSDVTGTARDPLLAHTPARSLASVNKAGGAIMIDTPGPPDARPQFYSDTDVPPGLSREPDPDHRFTDQLFWDLLKHGGLANSRLVALAIPAVTTVTLHQVFRAYLFCLDPPRTLLGYVAWGVLHEFRRQEPGKGPSATSRFNPEPRWIDAGART